MASRAASMSSLDQRPFVAGPPHLVALQALHGRHARLSSAAPFDHALQGLQCMIAVGLDSAESDGKRFLDVCLQIVFDPRFAPGQGQRRAGHQGDIQLLRPVPHPLGVPVVVGEVLVAEDRNGSSALGENAGDLFEEVPARVHVASPFVPRVVAVLAHQQHRVHAQGVAPGVQRPADTRVHGHAELFRYGQADVVFKDVVDVQGDHVDFRGEMPLVDRPSLQELRYDNISVGEGMVDRADRGDAQTGWHRQLLAGTGSSAGISAGTATGASEGCPVCLPYSSMNSSTSR